ncbi:MAG: hypothetical protein HQ559_14125, partial [Lentisphaerae bacterium]|nr:hypothetical protein [Lentisphaerota bacterium]
PPPTTEDPAAKIPDVDGEWRVVWAIDGAGQNSDFDLRLDQDGNDLEGISDHNGLAWDVEGVVEDDGEVEFEMESIGGTIFEFEGEVMSETKMEGTWAEVGTANKGEWKALKK